MEVRILTPLVALYHELRVLDSHCTLSVANDHKVAGGPVDLIQCLVTPSQVKFPSWTVVASEVAHNFWSQKGHFRILLLFLSNDSYIGLRQDNVRVDSCRRRELFDRTF